MRVIKYLCVRAQEVLVPILLLRLAFAFATVVLLCPDPSIDAYISFKRLRETFVNVTSG